MGNQPGSLKKLNREEFGRIRQNLKYRQKAETENASEKPWLPLDMGLFLTGKCNLRCRHCFEWSETGFLRQTDAACANRELPLETIEECLSYTKPAHTRLYLWGGEPLLYSRFHELCDLLVKDPRWTTICTNGLLIEERMNDLNRISDNLVLLISLDGLPVCNDAIRGKGTFERVVSAIRKLAEEKQNGRFHGEVSVCCVISDAMTDRLYEFCETMETLDINTLYLSFPWFIPEETAKEMDAVFRDRFRDLLPIEDYASASWHNFSFHISSEKIDVLKQEMKRIAERKWKMRVRYQPALEPEEIDAFITGGTFAAEGRKTCLTMYNRIDVLQGGEVSACKLFKEFTVGNLRDETIQNIWEGEKMAELRKRLSCGLMPVCSKCVLLYLNGK